MCVPTAGDGCVQGFCYLHAARVKWINGLTIWAAVKGPWLEESFQSGKQAQWCDEIREAVTFSNCSERVGWHGAIEKISANTEMTVFATFIKIFSYLLGDSAFSLVHNASGCTSFQYIFFKTLSESLWPGKCGFIGTHQCAGWYSPCWPQPVSKQYDTTQWQLLTSSYLCFNDYF